MDDSRYDLVPAGPPTLRYHTLCRSHPHNSLTLVVGDKGDICGVDTLDVTSIKWYGQKKCNSLDAVCEGGEAAPRRFSVTNLHSNHHHPISSKRARDDDLDGEEGHEHGNEVVGSNVVPGRRRRGPRPCIAMLVTPTTTTINAAASNHKGGDIYNIRPIEDILRVYRKHESVQGDSNLSNAWALSINTIESRAGYTTTKGEGVEGVEMEPTSIGDKNNARQEAAVRARAEFLEMATANSNAPATTYKPSMSAKRVVTVAATPVTTAPPPTTPTPVVNVSVPTAAPPNVVVAEQQPIAVESPIVDTYVSEVISQLVSAGGNLPPNPPITTTTAVLKALTKGHPKVKQFQVAKDREGLAALLDELRKMIVSELVRHKCVLNGSNIQYPMQAGL